MARTIRNRREALDNIAVGSAITSRERVIAGASSPTDADADNIAVGSANGAERVVAGSALQTGERLGS
jgi:hypothetical protein